MTIADNLTDQQRLIGEEILSLMAETAHTLGFDGASGPDLKAAHFAEEQDPFDGSVVLTGIWRDEHQRRLGEITIRADGLCWSEWDLLQPHPSRDGWFVEAITAWGRPGEMKAEPRLIAYPEE